MIRIELVKALDGEPVAVLFSPVIPEVTVVLNRRDPAGGDPFPEVWHIEGVADMEFSPIAGTDALELRVVRIAVVRSRFGGGAVKV